jgi:O-antigen/teichoic acid export membrane protein
VRETAKIKDEAERKKYLSTSFYLKLFLLGFCSLLIIAGIFVLPNKESAGLLTILGFLLIFTLLKEFFLALARSLEKMEIEALATIVEVSVTVILGFVLLKISATPRNLAVAYSIGAFWGFVIAASAFWRQLISITTNFEKNLVKKILNWAWPFAAGALIGSILTYTDTLMIGWLKPIADVGWYAAAMKIPILLIIPAALVSTSILPGLSRLAASGEKFKKIIRQAMGLLLALGAPLVAGGVILGGPIIIFLFGQQYSASIPSFKILLPLILINYCWIILGAALFVKNLQKQTMIFSALAAGLNVLLNSLLIPPYGLEGAAAATIISQAIGLIFVIRLFRKTTDSWPWSREELFKPVLAASMMILFLRIPAIKNSTLWFNIPLAGSFYFLFLYLLKTPIIKEGISFYRNLRSRSS